MKPLRPERPLESVLDANRLFEAALGESAILLLEADLGPVFFDLRTGLADEHVTHPMNLVPIDQTGATGIDVGKLPAEASAVLEATAGLYQLVGFSPPWICYFAVENFVAVGTCGFKSAPSGGRVEIAYFTFPDFQDQGVATATAAKLLAIAGMADPAVIVAAQTLLARNASHRVLEKHAFTCIGRIEHPEDGTVLEWQKANLRVA